MVPHPDTSPNNPGSLYLAKIETIPGGITFAMFGDGSIHQIDLKNQRYVSLGSLYNTVEDAAKFFLSSAHVLDGLVLKSFVADARGNSYLIKTDFSVSPLKASAPLLVQPIQGEIGSETPIAAHMVPVGDQAPQLILVRHGNFDSIALIDETSGASNPVIANMASSENPQPALLYCTEGTKDCDMWQTSAYDPISKKLYYQAHYIDTAMGSYDTCIYKLEFFKNTVAEGYSGYTSIAIDMLFGYAGYQFVNMV